MSLRRGTFTSWWYVALVLAACCTRAAAQPHGYLQTGKARDKNWHEFDSPPPVRTIEDVRRIRQWRDRMFDEPSLPTYLLAADAALKELAPAGPAAARAIADAGAALRLSGASEQKDQGNAAVTQGDAEYGATVAASQLPAGKDAAIVAAANSADGVGALTTKAQTTNDDDDGGADDDDDGALYGGALGPENVAPQRSLVIAEAKKAYKALNKRRKKKAQKSKKAAVADAVDVLQQHDEQANDDSDLVTKIDEANALPMLTEDLEADALREFYEQCNGPRWNNNYGWLKGTPCGSTTGAWHGVRCVGGRVTELKLVFNNVGCMYHELNITMLTRLYELRYVDLGHNLMSGTIPADIDKLRSLEALVLTQNNLDGTLPHALAKLPLKALDLSFNKLTGSLPESWGAMPKLEHMLLSDNAKIIGPLPSSWESMRMLRTLNLGGVRLGGAPPPAWLARLPRLRELTLSKSGLTGDAGAVLGAFTSSARLTVLSLHGNRLAGELPADIFDRLRHLQLLDLSSNRLEGDLHLGTSSPNHPLRTLRLASNRLAGTPLEGLELGNLSFPNLSVLDVADNSLEGTVSIAKASRSLRHLDASGNALSGMPFEDGSLWRNLPELRTLRLARNRVEGALAPPAATDVVFPRRLQELNVAENKLSGTIPAGLAMCGEMHTLDAAGNALEGALPDSIGNGPLARSLATFRLARNQLGGILPESYGRLELLESLDLSENSIEGVIPSSWKDLKLLEEANLSRNHLNGTLAPFLVDLPLLERLDLSRNRFTGALPARWRDRDVPGLRRCPPNGLPPNEKPWRDRKWDVAHNKLACPLPEWTRGSTLIVGCDWMHVSRLLPSSGAPGTRVEVRGRGYPSASEAEEHVDEKGARRVFGCLFGDHGVRGELVDDNVVVCESPKIESATEVVVRVGWVVVKSSSSSTPSGTTVASESPGERPIPSSRFGEAFVYK
ncbi:leucine-rich repeat protein [Pycnococcus provasolii]